MGLLGILFLAAIVSALLIMSFHDLDDGIQSCLLYMLTLSLTITVGFRIRKEWKVNSEGLHIPIIVVSTLAIVPIHIVLEPIQNLFPVPDFLNKMTLDISEYPWLYFFVVVIAAPVLEEIIFRGIILAGFLKNYRPSNAILVSAFLFALIHGNLAQGIGAFVIGLLLGWIYWKSNSIIPCIILHGINNAMGFAAFLLLDTEKDDSTLRELINNDIAYAIIYIGSVLTIMATLIFLKKKNLSFNNSEFFGKPND
jgi:membrane protease YdiL (CAAX protease family)